MQSYDMMNMGKIIRVSGKKSTRVDWIQIWIGIAVTVAARGLAENGGPSDSCSPDGGGSPERGLAGAPMGGREACAGPGAAPALGGGSPEPER